MTAEPRPAPAYLDPLHAELDRLRTVAGELGEKVAQYRDAIVPALESNADGWAKRADMAEARVDSLHAQLDEQIAFNRQRSDALNRTAANNDQLRATIARIERLCASAGDLDNGILVWDLRAALADQETT